MKKTVLLTGATMLLSSTALCAPTSATYEAVPTYRDDFTGGTPTFNWIVDPDASGAVSPTSAPTFTTTTPAGIDADIIADDPVASTDGVMVVGSPLADVATNFGLNYVIADNSLSGGGGDDFTALVNYKVVARIWTLGTNEYTTTGLQDRWAVGPYLHAGSGGGDLFRATMFYQLGATGNGPGWYTRGLAVNPSFTATPLTDGAWRLYTIMVNGDEVSVGYDADGNGTINEGDSAEFDSTLSRDLADAAVGAPGIDCVGEVSNDLFPILVDYMEVYLLAPSPLVINEVDPDQTGTDFDEFVEIYNAGGAAVDFSTNPHQIVLWNGSTDVAYQVIDLTTGVLPAGGYLVLGNISVLNVITADIEIDTGATDNFIQNGADGVGLYTGTAISVSDAATTAGIVDALVYGTSDPDDTGLMAALGIGDGIQANDDGVTSMGRFPDGAGAVQTGGAFSSDVPTPGGVNLPIELDRFTID